MKLEAYNRTLTGVEATRANLQVQFAEQGKTHVSRPQEKGTDNLPIDPAFAAQLLGGNFKPCANTDTLPTFMPLHQDIGKSYGFRHTPGHPDGPLRCICGACGYATPIAIREMATCRHPSGFSAIQGEHLNAQSHAILPVDGIGWKEQKLVADQTDGRLIIAFRGFLRITDEFMQKTFTDTTLQYSHASGDYAVATATSNLTE